MSAIKEYTPEQYREWIRDIIELIRSPQALSSVYRLANILYRDEPAVEE